MEISQILIEIGERSSNIDFANIISKLADKENELLTADEVAEALKISVRMLNENPEYGFWHEYNFKLHNEKNRRIRRKYLNEYITKKEKTLLEDSTI